MMSSMNSGTGPAISRPRPEDRYPSRFDPDPIITARLDPVVFGTADQGPLDASQLSFYDQNGYLCLDSLFTEQELDLALAELHRLRADPKARATEQAVIEPGSNELRSIFAIHRSNALLGRLCSHPRLTAVAQQLLGSQVYLHQSRINYKNGFRGKEFYWHSDFETWHVEDGIPAMRMLSCSISLTPNTPNNGPLMVMPGSHHHYISCVGITPEDHYRESLKSQEIGVPDNQSLSTLYDRCGIVAPTGPTGSVTFFDCNVMHGSNSNITPAPRSNLFIVYNSIENRPVEPFCGLAPRPNFIAERLDFTPVGP